VADAHLRLFNDPEQTAVSRLEQNETAPIAIIFRPAYLKRRSQIFGDFDNLANMVRKGYVRLCAKVIVLVHQQHIFLSLAVDKKAGKEWPTFDLCDGKPLVQWRASGRHGTIVVNTRGGQPR